MALRPRLIGASVLLLALLGAGVVAACDPDPTKPSIILVVTDDQTFDSVSNSTIPSTGDTVFQRTMPFLAQQVANDPNWVTFSKAFLNTPKCCPSRATILTGQYDFHTGVPDSDAAAGFRDEDSVASALKNIAGYRTSLVGKYLNKYPWSKAPAPGDQVYRPQSWDNWVAFYNDDEGNPYTGYTLTKNGGAPYQPTGPNSYSTKVLGDEAVAFIDSTPDSQPFFLMFTPRSGHSPWEPDPNANNPVIPNDAAINGPAFGHVGKVPGQEQPAWLQYCCGTDLDPAAQDSANGKRRAAYQTIQSADDQLERIWNALSPNQKQNTLIIFMTDNGLSIGEHNRVDLKDCAYEECIRTPLFVRYPMATPPTRTSSAFISAIDIAPTILDIAQVSSPLQRDGHSFKWILSTTTPPPNSENWFTSVLVHWGVNDGGQNMSPPYWAVRTNGFLYAELGAKDVINKQTQQVIAHFDPEKELYDLRANFGNDRGEQRNVIDDPAYTNDRNTMVSELNRLRGPTCPAVPPGC